MEQKKFVWDAKMKHRVELMIIILIITVLANIGVYYLNHNYEKLNAGNFGKNVEIVKQPTAAPLPKPTTVPVASTSASLNNCDIYKTTDYSICVPKNWLSAPKSLTEIQFQPKSIPTGIPVNYLTIQTTTIRVSPIPTPLKTYTQYKSTDLGEVTGYRADYIPQKSKDGFDIPLAEGCQDPFKILVAGKKKNLIITSCKQYEKNIQPLLETITLL